VQLSSAIVNGRGAITSLSRENGISISTSGRLALIAARVEQGLPIKSLSVYSTDLSLLAEIRITLRFREKLTNFKEI
jgi:hypothetical protein